MPGADWHHRKVTDPAIATATGFDVAALNVPVSPVEVVQFREEHRNSPGFGGIGRARRGVAAAIVAYSVLGLATEVLVVGLPVDLLVQGGLLVPGVLVAVILGGAIGWAFWLWTRQGVRNELGAGTGWARRVRLARFASANGFRYLPDFVNPPKVSSVLATGSGRRIDDLLHNPMLEVGNYRTDDRYNRVLAPAGWGFIRIRLPQRVPHLLMLPKKTRRLPARAIVAVRNDQIFQLEGDFDRHFTLYVPQGFGRDALYVLTPNLMALLIDRLPGAFVETLDAHLIIAVPTPLLLDRPETWDWMQQLLRTVGATSLRQTMRYQDERSAVPGQVSRAGLRLKVGIPVASVVAVIWVTLQVLHLLHVWH